MTGRRIGLVCPYSLDVPGGVQNHVLGLAGHLLGRGYDVRVLAPGVVHAERIAEAGFVADRVTSAGRTVAIRYNGSVARVNCGPLPAARVRRWLEVSRPDLVHVHEPITPSIALHALRAATVPVVATFHTSTPRSRLMTVAGSVLRRNVDRIDAGIAVSTSARQVVRDHLGQDPRIIPNGFDHEAFRLRSGGPVAPLPSTDRSSTAADRPRIAFLGRTDEPRKGLGVLLAALPAIRESLGPVEVLVAGRGRATGRLTQAARRAGVQLLGPVTDDERVALMATADVFVAPHRDRESFGIVVLEAMTAGAAVVASDIAAFTPLLGHHDGELGFSFRTGDPASLAAAVGRALGSDRRALAQRAGVATRRYDWSVVGPEITEVYDALPLPGAAPRRHLTRPARRSGGHGAPQPLQFPG